MIQLYRVFHDWRELLYSQIENLSTGVLTMLLEDIRHTEHRILAELERRDKLIPPLSDHPKQYSE